MPPTRPAFLNAQPFFVFVTINTLGNVCGLSASLKQLHVDNIYLDFFLNHLATAPGASTQNEALLVGDETANYILEATLNFLYK